MQNDKIYLSAADISKFYNIPLRTVYKRAELGYYARDGNGKICVDDVEKYLIEPIKLGRKFKK